MDLAGGLSRRQLDNCEKSVAAPSASRYFSIQFFASLEKWIGARNPVRIGSSCAAVTGYDFPLGQSPKNSGVKAGRRWSHRHHKPGARIFVRFTSFCSRRAVRDASASLRDAATEKLLRKKKNESWAMRRFENIRRLTSPTLGVGGNLLCKIVQSGFFVLGIAGILSVTA